MSAYGSDSRGAERRARSRAPRARRVGRLAGGLLLALALAEQAEAQSLSDPQLNVTTIVSSGLASPTAMGFVGPGDLLVLEQGGAVRRVLNGVLQPAPVLSVPVNDSSEHGLLGIAVNSETPRRVFLFYTESATPGGSSIANRVYRYTWNATTGLLESPLLILDLPVTPGPNHNGGTLLLGPPGEAPGVGDGALLYVMIGDLNRDNQLQNYASSGPPDDTSVIFRVRQDGTAAPGNPFTPWCRANTSQTCAGHPACGVNGPCELNVAKYYAYGVRNGFGLALDPVTGALWDTENGSDNFDEINRVAAGFNSGWERIMGPVEFDAEGTSDLFHVPGAGSTYSDPEFSWSLTIAPTAILFPVGSRLGRKYDSRALVGAFNSGQLYAIPLDVFRDGFDFAGFPLLADLVADNHAESDQLRIGTGFTGNFAGITDLKIGPDGALWVLSIGGRLYRIDGPGPWQPSVPALSAAGFAALGMLLAGVAAVALSGRRES